jgi:hypothetical protein
MPSDDITELDVEVEPVPGYDGDYLITSKGSIYSMKSGQPEKMKTQTQDSCEAVQLSRNGVTTKWSVDALQRRVFEGPDPDELYNDFRLAIDLYLDYDRSPEEIADIVPKTPDEIRHAIEIWGGNNLHRERWAR